MAKPNWGLKLTEEELKEQTENYETLGMTKSFRGISALFLCFSVVVSTVLILVKQAPAEAGFDIAVLAVLAFLVYKGYQWAIVVAMVFWTLEKALQLFASPVYAVSAALWWYLYELYFYKAYQVEAARHKAITAPSVVPPFPPENPTV